MDDTIFEKLKAIDNVFLTEIVRQDQNNSTFEITSWTVKRLSDKGIANPDGLWLFSGEGAKKTGETDSWSIVLKILNRPSDELTEDNVWYWKRELSFAQSNVSKHLPGPVKPPRIYHTEETPEGGWIWMEYVIAMHSAPWTLEEYAYAAHQLGLWNGSYLTGISLPSESWFTRQAYRSWLDAMNFEQDLEFPLHAKYMHQKTLTRYKQLWNERESFFKALENLPQVFSHFDSQRRNLFIRSNKAGQQELVLLDWGQCGIGAIGAELTWLIGLTVALLEWPPTDIGRLDQITFPSYVRGLNERCWTGEIDLVRLGFTSMFAAYVGCALISLIAWWCAPENSPFALQQFNKVEGELYETWLPLVDYSLERADEARMLMKKLGYE